MAKQFAALTAQHRKFIADQRMFFTASAADGTRINLSPRDTQWLRIASESSAFYVDRTGSGNETAAHLKADGRLTFMFCAVEGPPMILRLYGRGRVIARGSAEYQALMSDWFGGAEPLGARQIIWLEFDLVQTSCGFGVPLYDYRAERDQMDRWSEAKGKAGLIAYRNDKNNVSMDGLPTGLVEAEDEVLA